MADEEAQAPEENAAASEQTCCAQCGAAANQDPEGRDISQKDCARYIGYVVNGAAPVDEACGEWFTANLRTVEACRAQGSP